MEKVYIVGAGPGDPDLITVKGRKLLEKADVLIYAGSLVNPELIEASPAPEKYDSQGMKLEELVEIMVDAAKAGKTVVRLHSGDPALYGAIVEQVAVLEKHGIAVERVPGVSSMFGAAAGLKTLTTVTKTGIHSPLPRLAASLLPSDTSLAALSISPDIALLVIVFFTMFRDCRIGTPFSSRVARVLEKRLTSTF